MQGWQGVRTRAGGMGRYNGVHEGARTGGMTGQEWCKGTRLAGCEGARAAGMRGCKGKSVERDTRMVLGDRDLL